MFKLNVMQASRRFPPGIEHRSNINAQAGTCTVGRLPSFEWDYHYTKGCYLVLLHVGWICFIMFCVLLCLVASRVSAVCCDIVRRAILAMILLCYGKRQGLLPSPVPPLLNGLKAAFLFPILHEHLHGDL